MGRGAMTNRFRRPPGDIDVAVTSLEKRLSEHGQLADAQSHELRIQFERIAQLQAEWDVVRIRSGKREPGGGSTAGLSANSAKSP
jgi:hypothetical protein